MRSMYYAVLQISLRSKGVKETAKTENLCQSLSSLKQRKLISFCANELSLSIRCLEIL